MWTCLSKPVASWFSQLAAEWLGMSRYRPFCNLSLSWFLSPDRKRRGKTSSWRNSMSSEVIPLDLLFLSVSFPSLPVSAWVSNRLGVSPNLTTPLLYFTTQTLCQIKYKLFNSKMQFFLYLLLYQFFILIFKFRFTLSIFLQGS